MGFKRLSLSDAAGLMSLWKEDSEDYLEKKLDNDYRELRQSLINNFEKVDKGQKYALDYQFGLLLNMTLAKYGFTMRDAADDGVWRFLSLCVIPDLVGKRWGKGAEIRYYKQSGRIWLKTIWWYIHLSWQGDARETLKIIAPNSTDQILQLVDRSGTKGYYVEVYRRIMYYFWLAKQLDSSVGETEFRRVMTLHTAMCRSIEPGLFDGGYDGYARMLYRKVGVKL